MKRVIVVLAALAVALTAAGFALAQGSPKVELFGPLGHANCDGTPGTGDAGDWGFVVFSSPSDGTLSGLVSLKNAAPDTAFLVFLNQEGDCYKNAVGILTTNAQGNGVLRFSDAAVGSWAVVGLQSDSTAEQEFASGVFEH